VGADIGAVGGRGVVEDGGGAERLHHGEVARGAGCSNVEAGALGDAVSGGYFDHAVTGVEALREEEWGRKRPTEQPNLQLRELNRISPRRRTPAIYQNRPIPSPPPATVIPYSNTCPAPPL